MEGCTEGALCVAFRSGCWKGPPAPGGLPRQQVELLKSDRMGIISSGGFRDTSHDGYRKECVPMVSRIQALAGCWDVQKGPIPPNLVDTEAI